MVSANVQVSIGFAIFKNVYPLGYTHMGDAFSNALLREMFDPIKFKNALNELSFQTHPGYYIKKEDHEDEYGSDEDDKPFTFTFFPLYFQAIRKLKKTPKQDWGSSFLDEGMAPVVVERCVKSMGSLFEKYRLDRYLYFGHEVAYFLSIEKFWKPVIQDFIQDLNNIIQASPALPCDIRLFRGIKTTDYLKERRVCRVVGFLSTTASEKVARNFMDRTKACCVQEITVSRGVHVLPMAGISYYPQEHEFLFGSNTILYLSSMTDTKNVHKVALVQ